MTIQKLPMGRHSARSALLAAIFFCQFSNLAIAQTVEPETETPPGETDADPDAPPPAPVPPANQPTKTLAPVSVTATREPTTLGETPANVSVIEREDMDRRMQNSIQDLIRYEPGIIVDRQTSGTDPFKSLGGFTIRGVGGNRVLTLIDGNRVIERITDQTRDFVDLGNMKAVEIVRGPASALWGSDALGGVVAFTTKDPEDYIDSTSGNDWGFEANGFYDTYDNSLTENATAAGRLGKIEGLISYTRRDAEEPELTNAKNSGGVWPCTRAPESLNCDEMDPLNIGSDNILAKLVLNPNEDHKLKLTGEYFHRNTEVEQLWNHGRGVLASGAFSTTVIEDYDRQQVLDRKRLTLEHEWEVDTSFLDAVDWQLTYHPQDLDRNGVRVQSTPTAFTQVEESLLYSEDFWEGQAQFKSSFDIGDITNDLTYGFYASYASTDYERRDVTTNLVTGVVTEAIAGGFNFANADTTRVDGFLQNNIGLFDDRLNIIPGVRYATYTINPDPGPGYAIIDGKEPRTITETDLAAKVGITFQIDDNYSLYGQYGEGFKMPTAEQLFTSLPLGAQNLVPNPDLKPESVKNYEIGMRGEFDSGFFSVNGFYSDYKNFIQSFVQINATDITYQNLASVEIWGIEGSGAWRFHPNWEVNSAMSWQIGNTVASAGDEELPFNGAEPFKIVSGIRYIEDDLGLDFELVGTYQMAHTRLNDSPVEDFSPDDYFVLDANMQWRPFENLALRASVLNILDERYFLPSASAFDASPTSSAVMATNPIELQTQPGRTFRVGLSVSF
jgi:hemoglobin/transferrin/lactoferrin receptor protein